jgi:hypothetical protein
MPSNPLHPYPFLGENNSTKNKDQMGQYTRQNNDAVNENSCNIMPSREDVRKSFIFISSYFLIF